MDTAGHDQATVGILMLDTRFPRVLGDGGNRATWPFPVIIKKVVGATPTRVVDEHAQGLLEPFKEGARELVAQGADGITTTCGFLALFQKELADCAGVPVAASSIVQVPLVQRLIPSGKRVGILTADSRNLTEQHLAAAGVPLDTPVVGTEGGRVFTRVFTDRVSEYEFAQAEADVVEAGGRMIERYPHVGAFEHERAGARTRLRPAGLRHLHARQLVPGGLEAKALAASRAGPGSPLDVAVPQIGGRRARPRNACSSALAILSTVNSS